MSLGNFSEANVKFKLTRSELPSLCLSSLRCQSIETNDFVHDDDGGDVETDVYGGSDQTRPSVSPALIEKRTERGAATAAAAVAPGRVYTIRAVDE